MRVDQIIGLWLFREYQAEARRPWRCVGSFPAALRKPRRGVIHLGPNHLLIVLWRSILEFKR